MSIERIAGVFLQTHLGQGQRFVLHAPGDHPSQFTIGQIIKGRVLRHVDGNRYAIQVGDEEKVVDSSIPLQTGELLYGRVIALGEEHMDMERVHVPQAMSPSQLDSPPRIAEGIFPRSIAEQVVSLFTRFGASLDEPSANILNQALRTSPDTEAAIYAGLILAKLGLSFTPDKLAALTRALTADPRHALFDERQAIYLASRPSAPVGASVQPDHEGTDNDALARTLADIADGPARDNAQAGANGDSTQDGNGQSKDGRGLGYELLNLQVDGALGHRVATVPLVVDGQLLELNIGLVDQRESRLDQTATAHRRLAFTLDTDALGTVAVLGTLTGEHIQLTFQVENAEALDTMQSHAGLLNETLQEAGFSVDAIRHDVATWREMHSVAWLAAQSVIHNDSLDRWI